MGRRSTPLRRVMVATERQLFELLDASAAAIERSAEVLESVVHHWPESDALVSELSALRHSSDERSEKVSALSDALCAAVRRAETVSWLFGIYRPTHSREHARRATHLLAAPADNCAAPSRAFAAWMTSRRRSGPFAGMSATRVSCCGRDSQISSARMFCARAARVEGRPRGAWQHRR